MKFKLNGQWIELTQVRSVADILEHLDILTTEGIAVAVNDAVVSKSNYADKTLIDNDIIEIIRATQGG